MPEMGLVREGHIFEDSAEVDALREELRELRRALAHAESETAKTKKQAERATANLRRQLSPLYRALQDVFGELEDIGGTDDAQTVAPPRVMAVWDNWKSKLGSTAKLIDALLLHGEMNTQQLSVATGFHRTTIPAHIFKLNKNGLINKNGGKFSLKKL